MGKIDMNDSEAFLMVILLVFLGSSVIMMLFEPLSRLLLWLDKKKDTRLQKECEEKKIAEQKIEEERQKEIAKQNKKELQKEKRRQNKLLKEGNRHVSNVRC
jgi:hypothetical protein